MAIGRRMTVMLIVWLMVPGPLDFAGTSVAADNPEIDSAIKEVAKAAKKARVDSDFKLLVDQLLKISGDAVNDDGYTDAARALSMAGDFARKSGSNQLIFRVKQKTDEVRVLSREFKQLAGDVRKLADDANDPSANQAIGLFRCVGQGQWSVGGRLLAKSKVDPFMEIGRGEIAQPKVVAEQVNLARKWQSAPIEDEWLKHGALLRAHHWYATAYRTEPEGPARNALQESLRALPVMYLTDMKEDSVGEGPWGLGKYGARGSLTTGSIAVDGHPYALALGVHPHDNASFNVRYKLNGEYRTLTAGCGLCDSEVGFSGTLVFSVLGDGRQLWVSRPVKNRRDAEFATINVKGVQNLEICCRALGSAHAAHAVWLDPYLAR